MGNMRFKVGDRVKIKSLDWYNRNTNGTEVDCVEALFTSDMKKFCSHVMTISYVYADCYSMIEDIENFYTDEMIEGLAEEEEVGLVDKLSSRWVNEFNLPDGYIFKDENGNVINATKIVLEKKKKEYPKTYEECCKVLGVDPDNFLTIRNMHRYDGEEETTDYERDLLGKFDSLWELRICRDAYWKIAGEEMGLGKPWEPDWSDTSIKYCLERDFDAIDKNVSNHKGHTFAFPTPEMRDAFKENFDPDIEICKEFL